MVSYSDFQESQQSIAERAGYQQGAVADEAELSIRDMIARRRGAHTTQSVTPAVPTPVKEQNQVIESEQHEVSASGSSSAASNSAASSTTPATQGAQGSGPQEASTPSDDEQQQLAETEAEATDATNIAAVESRGAEEQSHDSEETVEGTGTEVSPSSKSDPLPEAEPASPTVANVQHIRVVRGEPISDAELQPRTSFKFDDSGTIQLKSLPKSIESRLRQDLTLMTNYEFAHGLSISSLVTAFIVAQLGLATASAEEEQIDENTRTAIKGFRRLDGRTSSIEEQLSKADEMLERIDGVTKSSLHALMKFAEKFRFQENALSFLVTERIEPTSMANTPPEQVPLIDGKYKRTRDRLLQMTDAEIRNEKLSKGRPIR